MQRGWFGWLAIAGVVAVADIYAVKKGLETMTAAYARCPRKITLPVTAIVVAHLYGVLPKRLDPFEWLGAQLSPRTGGQNAA